MNAEQERLLQEPVFRHFHTLCQIPHPSFREEQISRYLFDWACERGLEAHRDAHRNVLIRKPAAAEYENAPGVMLQAHMDMVCEKASGAAQTLRPIPSGGRSKATGSIPTAAQHWARTMESAWRSRCPFWRTTACRILRWRPVHHRRGGRFLRRRRF